MNRPSRIFLLRSLPIYLTKSSKFAILFRNYEGKERGSLEKFDLYHAITDFNSFYVHYLANMNQAFSGERLNVTGMRCMVFIKASGRSTQKELSERFGIDMAYLSRTVKALLNSGYLTKEDNEADGRSHFYDLTEAGKAAVAAQEARMLDYVLSTVAHLSADEQEELAACFSRIRFLLSSKGEES